VTPDPHHPTSSQADSPETSTPAVGQTVGQPDEPGALVSPLEQPLVIPDEEPAPVPAAPGGLRGEAEAPDRAEVHVSAQIDAVLAGMLAAPAGGAAAGRRDLDMVVHRLLIVGLAASSLLMVIGLILDVALHRQMPTAIPDLGEMLARVLAGRPSGFLSLGLLVLLATPIVRVVGSIAAFVYERDWRYAVVSLIVLLVVVLSVVLGQG
jgi:uncharacterized membrane protein